MKAALAVVWPVPPPAIATVLKLGLADEPPETNATPLVELGETPVIFVEEVATAT